MNEKTHALNYGYQPRRKGIRLVIVGSCLIALAVVMSVVAGGIFVLPTMPARPIYWLGFSCFWGFLPTGIVGVIVLIVGAIRRNM